MALFKKKKIEEIILPDLTLNVPEVASTPSSDTPLSVLPASISEIIERYRYLECKNEDIMNAYYVCRIFSYIAIKDSDFDHQMNAIEKHIKRLSNFHLAISECLLTLKSEETPQQEMMDDLYEKMKETLLFHEGITNILDDARRKYFNHLKIATLNVCLNRKNIELEKIYHDLVGFLKDYKSLDDAAQTVYYNSGQIIHQMVDVIIEEINDLKNLRYIKAYPSHYFIKSDVVITLSFPEWIELYNRVKFVMKSAVDVNLAHCINFRQVFDQFELRYLILMMNLERSTQQKN
ncbi:MAG: hypothetical protein WC182_02050 [Bacilli bacterium]